MSTLASHIRFSAGWTKCDPLEQYVGHAVRPRLDPLPWRWPHKEKRQRKEEEEQARKEKEERERDEREQKESDEKLAALARKRSLRGESFRIQPPGDDPLGHPDEESDSDGGKRKRKLDVDIDGIGGFSSGGSANGSSDSDDSGSETDEEDLLSKWQEAVHVP